MCFLELSIADLSIALGNLFMCNKTSSITNMPNMVENSNIYVYIDPFLEITM